MLPFSTVRARAHVSGLFDLQPQSTFWVGSSLEQVLRHPGVVTVAGTAASPVHGSLAVPCGTRECMGAEYFTPACTPPCTMWSTFDQSVSHHRVLFDSRSTFDRSVSISWSTSHGPEYFPLGGVPFTGVYQTTRVPLARVYPTCTPAGSRECISTSHWPEYFPLARVLFTGVYHTSGVLNSWYISYTCPSHAEYFLCAEYFVAGVLCHTHTVHIYM